MSIRQVITITIDSKGVYHPQRYVCETCVAEVKIKHGTHGRFHLSCQNESCDEFGKEFVMIASILKLPILTESV